MRASREFLGAGIAYPYRAGAAGLPDLEFAVGPEAVRSAVGFMLRTTPGELLWDPALGLDPEILRFDPTDLQEAIEAQRLIEASLVSPEPRIHSLVADVRPDARARTLNIGVSYQLIESNVPENLVVLPEASHEDVLAEIDEAGVPISGQLDDSLLGIVTG